MAARFVGTMLMPRVSRVQLCVSEIYMLVLYYCMQLKLDQPPKCKNCVIVNIAFNDLSKDSLGVV